MGRCKASQSVVVVLEKRVVEMLVVVVRDS